jgi:hypothetical protein
VALPTFAFAQEAVLTGTITDATGGVLPGVTVQAVSETSGNSFEAVTDGRGVYRIPARIGSYKVTAQLTGFSIASRGGIELLVGQTLTLNLQLAPSALQETVTVTGEAPLIQTQSSAIGGTIDPRQVSELPSLGRNWMSLALLAPGNRTNAEGATPVQDRGDVREFNLNVDGMQVSANMGAGGQARYSNDSIAEFQFISNRFDATQGRSSGVQVNAITKSGSNNLAGSLVGNFRNSSWNAPDPVLNRVLPYKNQQISGTVGGPIVLNKTHFFGNVEYEHQPLTSIWNTPYPAFNITLNGTRTVKLSGIRLDQELSSKMRVMGKVSHSRLIEPFGAGATTHPAGTMSNIEHNTDIIGSATNVFSNRAVNEVRSGYASYGFFQDSLVKWSHHWDAANGVTSGSPKVTFRGFSVPGNSNLPRYRNQNVYSIHDDFTFSYGAGGHHDLKVGGEYLHTLDNTRNCNNCMGGITAQNGPVPANVEALFPVWNDADTWNLAALSPITTRYKVGVSDASNFLTPLYMWKYGAWAQDDWKISNRLTLNLGARYDLIWNAFAQSVTFEPTEKGGRPQDAKNLQPRLGFAYSLDNRTVLRGGAGLYYNDMIDTDVLWPQSVLSIAVIAVDNVPVRADFAANPFSGPLPTYAQALQRFCSAGSGAPNSPAYTAWAASGFAGAAPCLLRDLQEQSPIPQYAHVTHSWQSSIGIARQFGSSMALEADLVNTASRAEHVFQDNVNISFDPATGNPYPYADVAHRPFPMFGIIGMTPQTGQSDYRGLQTSFTKRMSHHWQGSITYTLGALWTKDPPPLSGTDFKEVTFTVAPDIAGERTLGPTDQRHRAVFNGIWQVGKGLQLSGIYFYGSGLRGQIVCGCDARGLGIGSIDRLRLNDPQGPNGSIIPRYSFVGTPLHRVEMRVIQHVRLHGKAGIDGSLEVFNLFNRANIAGYNLTETSASFMKPNSSTNLAYAPRTVQLGFRLTF